MKPHAFRSDGGYDCLECGLSRISDVHNIKPAEVIELGPHSNMTPEQALAVASREEWSDVIIVGYHKGDGDLIVRSSHMDRKDALWMAEFLKDHVKGL